MEFKKSFWRTRILCMIDSYNKISLEDKLDKEEILDDLNGKDTEYYLHVYLNVRYKYHKLTKKFINNQIGK